MSNIDLKSAKSFLLSVLDHHPTGSYLCLTEMPIDGKPIDTFIRKDKHWKRKIGNWLKEQSERTSHKFYAVNSFCRRRRKEEDVNPTVLAHVDADAVDINDLLPKPNWIIETSPRNFQLIFLLDRPLSPHDIQSISMERTYNLRADKGGHSPAKLLRIPGFPNVKAKYGPDYPMATLQSTSSEVHSADEMLRKAAKYLRAQKTKNNRAHGALAEAKAYKFKELVQRYQRDLPGWAVGRLRQDRVYKDAWTFHLQGKSYTSPPDDRSEIVWALTNAALDAGLTNGEAMKLTTGSVFWRDREDDGRPFDPEVHLGKILLERDEANDNWASDSEWGIDPSIFHGKDVPVREWLVEDWIPIGKVTSIYGDGGAGKTTLALQLVAAAVTGSDWLGLSVKNVNAYVVLCENSTDDTHIALDNINRSLGVSFEVWNDKCLVANREGLNTELMTFEQTEIKLTEAFQKIRSKVIELDARLIVFDTAADGFSGNESDRQQVRKFLQRACLNLALETNAAFVLLAHPSISGMKDGTGLSGSTGWNNTVRSRLYFRRPNDDDDIASTQENRVLIRMKSNLAPEDEKLNLRWDSGVFVPMSIKSNLEDDGMFEKVKDKVEQQWKAGWPFAANYQAGPRYIVTWLMSEFRLSKKKAQGRLNEWLVNGLLLEDTFETKSKKKGLRAPNNTR